MKIHKSITQQKLLELCQEREEMLENPGVCIVCGAEHSECEPDARKRECEECGKMTVYAPEEILMSQVWR